MPKLFSSSLSNALVLGFVSSIALFSGSAAAAENWPSWRGPRGDGTSDEKKIPTNWNAKTGENIAWQTAVPGRGHSSPIVWEDRVFVVTCLEDSQDRALLCFDVKTGKLLWQKAVVHSPLEKKHDLNSFASGTPATDGKLVYVTFLEVGAAGGKPGQMVVAAYDFSGEQKWLVRPGKFSSVHGFCTSPVLFEDMVIVNGDHDGDGYLAALRRTTGEVVWIKPRENKTRSYCTPLFFQHEGRTQMVMSGSKCVTSYDPRTGERLWYLNGPTEQFVASLVFNGKLLFLTAGFPEHHMLAIKPDGQGNVGDTHIVWRTTKGCSYVPSPIAAGKYFLVTSDEGMGSCFEAESGKRYWQERMGPHFSGSPVLVGGLVYFTSDDGQTKVVRPGETYEVVGKGDLGERVYSSPAVSQGMLLFRGEKQLIAISAAGRE